MEKGGVLLLVDITKERFQIMFVIRFSRQNFLSLVGVDFDNSCLFSVLLYCENEQVDLEYNTSHYPKELMNVLKQNEQLLNKGWYDIRTWELTIFDQNLKERKSLDMSSDSRINDGGLKKWSPFKSLQEQWQLLKKNYEDDNKVSMPIIQDDEFQEINNCILHSLESQSPILLRLYDSGDLKEIDGVVSKVDPYTKIVKIQDNSGSIKNIKFIQIIGAKVI
jgi:hypothetical protein